MLSFEGSSEKERVVLSITDNGAGMDEKSVSRAFEKGFTGNNGRVFNKSTGIGLYLSKKLSDRLGIELSISSEVNKGTKVDILFPKESMINDVTN